MPSTVLSACSCVAACKNNHPTASFPYAKHSTLDLHILSGHCAAFCFPPLHSRSLSLCPNSFLPILELTLIKLSPPPLSKTNLKVTSVHPVAQHSAPFPVGISLAPAAWTLWMDHTFQNASLLTASGLYEAFVCSGQMRLRERPAHEQRGAPSPGAFTRARAAQQARTVVQGRAEEGLSQSTGVPGPKAGAARQRHSGNGSATLRGPARATALWLRGGRALRSSTGAPRRGRGGARTTPP